jgi:carboxymethylenebutenolidase
VPAEQRQTIVSALSASDVRHELVEYPGAGHGFLYDRRESYDPAAADDPWQRIEQPFAEELTRAPVH